MAIYFTGANGSLLVDGTEIAKIRNWSLTGSIETLDITTTGDTALEFIYGRQSYSGSCTALYYETDAGALAANALLVKIIRTDAPSPTGTKLLRLQLSDYRVIEANVFFTQVGIACTTGDLVSVDISFQVTGHLVTATMGAA
jgi:hypothetical protein